MLDFDDITITADSIEDGINFIREKISKCISHGFSPHPSPFEQIQLGQNEMIIMVNV